MSAFLVNLARRSAGLASVVRARPSLPLMAMDAPAAPAADFTPAHDSLPPSAPIAIAMPVAAPLAPEMDAPRDAGSSAPLSMLPAPTLIIHRAPASIAAAPVTPSAPMARGMEAPSVSPRAVGTFEGAAPERASVQSVLPRALESPAPARSSERPFEAVPAAVVPSAIVRIDPASEALWQGERTPVVIPGSTQIVERVIDTAANDVLAPAAVTIQPSPTTAAAAPTPIDRPPERTVHVRIGAIEIYGAAAGGAPAQAAIAPSVPSTRPPVASPASGFDDYAALRSYAPWTW